MYACMHVGMQAGGHAGLGKHECLQCMHVCGYICVVV